jgi:mannose-1-phosphate guanylyltransferase / mannose-6-phosphate isomerase
MGSRPLIPVIMCGGAGRRLWPVSRESMPKQFVPLVEARSTFQQVLGRIRDATIFDRPIVITHSDFRFIAAEQMRACAVKGDIVLEPIRRDSAMAVGVAATRDPASTAIVLAADHVVRDPEAFARACRDAMSAAANGRIVTFGIGPTFPATNYGYIRPGAKLDGGSAFAVDAFVEKPDAATAGRYIADRYLWNSGNFVFRADVMLGEIARRTANKRKRICGFTGRGAITRASTLARAIKSSASW